jgi:glucokinase
MILTIDIGSSFIKSALVDDAYQVHEAQTNPTDFTKLNQIVAGLVHEHRPDEIGIAAGLPYSHEKMLYQFDGDKRVDLLDASQAFLYIDSEAAGLALNLGLNTRFIQPPTSDVNKNSNQALVYLGTGFQFVPCTHTDSKYLPGFALGSLMPASGKVLSGELRNIVAKIADVPESQLRMSHLLSSRGLRFIHQAITGRTETAYDIIDGENQETFLEYSKILGRALQTMVTGSPVWGGLVLGGTFASVISGKLDDEAIMETFNDVGRTFQSALASIPISVIEDRYATNKAIAFGIRNSIETSVYAFE